jgi:hypothetical protein
MTVGVFERVNCIVGKDFSHPLEMTKSVGSNGLRDLSLTEPLPEMAAS